MRRYREKTADPTPALLTSTVSPFKFNRAVLEALGRNPGEKDEFDLLQELGQLSGLPIPAKLAELEKLPELHKGVCAQDEMDQVLYRFLGVNGDKK